MSWGNAGGTTEDQHMQSPVRQESPNGRHLTAIYNDDDHAALVAHNEAAGGKALQVEGPAEIVGLTSISEESEHAPVLYVENSSDDAVAIRVERGRLDVGLDGILCEGLLQLGSRQTYARIEGYPTPQPGAITIGAEETTGHIYIGRIGQTCTINSALEIGADEDDPGLIDAALDGEDPRDLNIGTQASTANVNLGRNGQDVNVVDDLNVGGDCAVTGSLVVGPADGAASIDAGGTPNAQNLNIGAQNTTATVAIGRAGQDVNVVEDLNVFGGLNVGPANNELQILSNANESRIERQGGETTLFINADVQREGGDVVISHPDNPNVSTPSVIVQSSRLRVGPGNDSGLIDANSGGDPPASRALCIGTNSQQTSHVKIGNHVAGQPQHVIQAETQMVFAGNAIILNGAQSITDANAVGLICDVPGRIDFVCNGQRRGWHDWDGFHNPPLP